MRNAFFIALHDIRYQLRQGATLLWLFVMPPIFMYFIGTVTGGFSSASSGSVATPLTVVAAAPGFLKPQIDKRLRDNDFIVEWQDIAFATREDSASAPTRTLTFPDGLTDLVLSGVTVTAVFDTPASSLLRDFERMRIERSLFTVLADLVVAKVQHTEAVDGNALDTLNARPRLIRLQHQPAGQRREIPRGFEQTVPGILVMFTLLVLLTSGASMLAVERRQGLLRRLAAAPITPAELIGGKWGGRMGLALVQIAFALLAGTFWFRMHWGPDIVMVYVVLLAWAAFCASAGLLLGSIARTEGQAAGLGVLFANLLAALGGCWWPIEITPDWMQFLQKLLPTGWTMDALHQLISFESGATAAVPHLVALLLAAAMVAALAISRFRYE